MASAKKLPRLLSPRKPITSPQRSTRSKRLYVLLEPRLYSCVQKFARTENRSLASVARLALKSYLRVEV